MHGCIKSGVVMNYCNFLTSLTSIKAVVNVDMATKELITVGNIEIKFMIGRSFYPMTPTKMFAAHLSHPINISLGGSPVGMAW